MSKMYIIKKKKKKKKIKKKKKKKGGVVAPPPPFRSCYLFYSTPCSTIDLATFIKPAMFAPFM